MSRLFFPLPTAALLGGGAVRPVALRDAPKDSIGVITTDEAPGAWKNGSVVRKVSSLPGDAHPDGSLGMVRGSLGPHEGKYGYFVAFASGAIVLCLDARLALVEGEA